MDTQLYTKHGKPWGFIKDDFVYKNPNKFIGWIEDNEVYAKNGQFIGMLTNNMFIVRDKNAPTHTKNALKYATMIPGLGYKQKPLDIIPNDSFLRADEIDCLENM